MTAEEYDRIKRRLADIQPIISLKKTITPAEATEIFSLYNAITGENKVVTTCPACVNGVVSRLKKECRNAGI